MKKIIPIFILGFIIFLSGCKLGPNFQRPDYEGPSSFRFDSIQTDTIVNLRWWDLFNDPVLDTLIQKALENNKDIMVAAARVEASKANLGFTKADQWPSFGLNVGASSGNSLGTVQFSSVSNSFYAYPTMNWEIGFWGKYRRLNEAAQASLLASEYGKRTIQLGLISAVASTYFTILSSCDQLKISTNTLASRDSGLYLMEGKYEGGLISLIDLNQAQIQRDLAATAVPTYKRIIALNEDALSILLGKMPHDIELGIPFHK